MDYSYEKELSLCTNSSGLTSSQWRPELEGEWFILLAEGKEGAVWKCVVTPALCHWLV